MTSAKKRANHIEKIQMEKGLREDPISIKEKVALHFEKLYREKQVLELKDIDWNFGWLNDDLVRKLDFEEEEVWGTIRGCDGNKALGLDGCNLNFFKHQWKVVKKDVMEFMSMFHRNGQLGRGINASFIALVPKVVNPTNLGEYMAISLVSNLYKIVVKIIVNRSRNWLGKLLRGINSRLSRVGSWWFVH